MCPIIEMVDCRSKIYNLDSTLVKSILLLNRQMPPDWNFHKDFLLPEQFLWYTIAESLNYVFFSFPNRKDNLDRVAFTFQIEDDDEFRHWRLQKIEKIFHYEKNGSLRSAERQDVPIADSDREFFHDYEKIAELGSAKLQRKTPMRVLESKGSFAIHPSLLIMLPIVHQQFPEEKISHRKPLTIEVSEGGSDITYEFLENHTDGYRRLKWLQIELCKTGRRVGWQDNWLGQRQSAGEEHKTIEY
jgi:hypothetical protein